MTTQKKLHKLHITTYQEAQEALTSIGTTSRGISIMKEKMLFQVIHIHQLDTRAANILKQTLLSQGGDVAVSAATVNLTQPYTDAVLFGTVAQIKRALERLEEQPWGLKALAEELKKYLENLQ